MTRRKPLRRTAWTLFVGGLALTVLMLGVGAYVVSRGEPADRTRTAAWPAGADIAVVRPVGPSSESGEYVGPECTVTTPGEPPVEVLPTWQDRTHPVFPTRATLTCNQPVRVLTGAAITAAGTLRGPLIAIPLVAMFLGLLLFFPRLTGFAASLSHPFGRAVTRLTGRRARPF